MSKYINTKITNNKQDWSFQDDAINALFKFYKTSLFSKKLLVIPTGGGKTLTALRTLSKLLDENVLSPNDRVVWTVHSKTLRKQAETELNNPKNIKDFNFNKNLGKVVEVRMKEKAKEVLMNDKSGIYKLIIIDEAHHSAANSYKDFFSKNIGILGLTATPTRNDESELQFEGIAYSITFRELIARKVVLMPKFIPPIETNLSIKISTLDESNSTQIDAQFNTDERNRIISEYLIKKNLFKKIIVFVPTNNHVDALYKKLSAVNELYNSPFKVGYIYSDIRNGKTNDLSIDNDKYLDLHKELVTPSILINCAMLNEGYNDPDIDTVVLAVPTKSILYYMQCVGRVVRNPTGISINPNAYVVEFVDNLPNFVYRIDNKWLFADISDYLEPKVREVYYSSDRHLREIIDSLVLEHNVFNKYSTIVSKGNLIGTISLMLLKPTRRDELNEWIPLLLNEENRKKYVDIYNEIGDNIGLYRDINQDFLFHEKLRISKDDEYFGIDEYKSDFIHTLKNAHDEKNNKKEVKRIIYYNFIYKKKYSIWWLWLKKLFSKLINSLT